MVKTDIGVLVDLSVSQWTARKYDKSATKDMIARYGAVEGTARVNKVLVNKRHTDQIKKLVNQIRLYHYEHTLPWSNTGTRLLPIKRVEPYLETMRGYKAQFETMVNAFLAAYRDMVEEAPETLGRFFNMEDYPKVEALQRKFAFSMDILPMPTEGDFRIDIKGVELDRLKREFSQRAESRTQRAVQDCWTRIHKVLRAMVDRLGAPNAVFRDSLIENARELVQLLPDLNITGDENLEAARRLVEDQLCNVDAQTLREDKDERKKVAKAAQDITDIMGQFMGGGQ